jgi:propionyl-CoA carboxylase alpha chain
MVTGIDLVKEQINIAAGFELSFKQEDIKWNGHSIECRIYAEDSYDNFMPVTGRISYLREPGGYGVRLDSGIESGNEVSIHFDPMLAKLVVWGKDRHDAINRMIRALKNYRVKGIKTTIPFELAVMGNDVFRDGYFDTGFIEEHFDIETLNERRREFEEEIAAIAAYGFHKFDSDKPTETAKADGKGWKAVGRARNLV